MENKWFTLNNNVLRIIFTISSKVKFMNNISFIIIYNLAQIYFYGVFHKVYLSRLSDLFSFINVKEDRISMQILLNIGISTSVPKGNKRLYAIESGEND